VDTALAGDGAGLPQVDDVAGERLILTPLGSATT